MSNLPEAPQAEPGIFWIPVNLALYVEQNNLIEEFKLYVTLKLHCSGKIHATSQLQLLKQLGLDPKHRTTFNKRLKKLRELNWIGYSGKSGYYFIRSFESLCSALEINPKRRVKFSTAYFAKFRIFVFAALVCDRINRMQWAKQKAFRKKRSEKRLVPLYWDNGTNQQLDSPSFLKYNGLPGSVMARMTGKASSTCIELRKEAHKAGFLISKEKKELVDIVPKTPYMREILREDYGSRSGRFTVKAIRGLDLLKVIEQLPNEIKPLLEFKTR